MRARSSKESTLCGPGVGSRTRPISRMMMVLRCGAVRCGAVRCGAVGQWNVWKCSSDRDKVGECGKERQVLAAGSTRTGGLRRK